MGSASCAGPDATVLQELPDFMRKAISCGYAWADAPSAKGTSGETTAITKKRSLVSSSKAGPGGGCTDRSDDQKVSVTAGKFGNETENEVLQTTVWLLGILDALWWMLFHASGRVMSGGFSRSG